MRGLGAPRFNERMGAERRLDDGTMMAWGFDHYGSGLLFEVRWPGSKRVHVRSRPSRARESPSGARMTVERIESSMEPSRTMMENRWRSDSRLRAPADMAK